MLIPAIILFGAMAIGLSQAPIVIRDLVNEIKDIYKEGDSE